MKNYEVPSSLLECTPCTVDNELAEQTKEVVLDIFKQYKIEGEIFSISYGPTVTTYHYKPKKRFLLRYCDAIEYELAMRGFRDAYCTINGYDRTVDLEVPNIKRKRVCLGSMLQGEEYVHAPSSSLTFAMGKDLENNDVYGDLTKMPHALVAGAAASGKSVFIHSMLISLICKHSPKELRLILIDPKRTEFTAYNGLPHLLTGEVITDVKKTLWSLDWAIEEMERRFTLFENMGKTGQFVLTVDRYNEVVEEGGRLPKIVIVIDEMADLMLMVKKEITEKLLRLLQKSRATGIHVVVSTQRPSVQTIPGVIKANLVARFAFAVPTHIESCLILDKTGAQKLLGRGDFLYMTPYILQLARVQSAFVSDQEIHAVVEYIKKNVPAEYDIEQMACAHAIEEENKEESEIDPRYIEVLRTVIENQSVSISFIQRKCSMGYNRAWKVVEWLEDMGYVTPFDGAKARKVLITMEEFDKLYGE